MNTHTHRFDETTPARTPKARFRDKPPAIPVHSIPRDNLPPVVPTRHSTPHEKPPVPVRHHKLAHRDDLPPVIPVHKPTPRNDSSLRPPLPAPREKPPLPPVPVRDTTG